MPLPKPISGEDKPTFMERCISDDNIHDEFPTNEQRVAVCNHIWLNRKNDVLYNEIIAEGLENMSKKNRVMEHKTLSLTIGKIEETKAENGKKERVIEGYASTFNNIDAGGDIVRPGAFKKTLQDKNRGRNVKFLYQHHSYEPIGVPVEIREDEKGLFFKAVFADTVRANDAYELAKMGALDGFSIGYRTIKYTDNVEDGTRELLELDLAEVSLVTFEMNTQAKVTSVKSAKGDALILKGLIELGHSEDEALKALKELSLHNIEPNNHSVKEADDITNINNDVEESRKAIDVLHSLRKLKEQLQITE